MLGSVSRDSHSLELGAEGMPPQREFESKSAEFWLGTELALETAAMRAILLMLAQNAISAEADHA
jgi:hypothetical protein